MPAPRMQHWMPSSAGVPYTKLSFVSKTLPSL